MAARSRTTSHRHSDDNRQLLEEASTAALIDIATRQIAAGQYNQAALSYARVLDTGINATASTWADYGECLYHAKRYQNAVDAFKTALDLGDREAKTWRLLGATYEQLAKPEFAAECYEVVVFVAPVSPKTWLRLVACYDAMKDFERLYDAISRALKVSPREAQLWHRLGTLNYKDKRYHEAQYAYWKASYLDDSDPTVFFNRCLSHQALGQLAEAYRALQRSASLRADHKRTTDMLATLEPQLQKHLQALKELDNGRHSLVAPYDGYINPYELLQLDASEPPDEGRMAYAKKQLLAEVKLNDGRVSWMPDLTIDQSRIQAIVRELEDTGLCDDHRRVAQDERMLRFLTHGDLRLFQITNDLSEPPRRPDGVICCFEFFAVQYDRIVLELFRRNQPESIGALIALAPALPPDRLELCHQRTRAHLEAIHKEIEECGEQLSDSTLESFPEWLYEQFDPAALNALPEDFLDLRSRMAMTIRNISVAAANDHDLADIASQILRVASSITSDHATRTRLRDDAEDLDNLLVQNRKRHLELTFARGTFRITRTHIQFGAQRLQLDQITRVRWGIWRYPDAIGRRYSYEIALVDHEERSIEVECYHKPLLSVRDAEPEAKDRFMAIVDSLHYSVVPAIIERMLTRMGEGGQVAVGPIHLTRDGVLFQRGMLFWRKELLVPWSKLVVNLQNGYVLIGDRSQHLVEHINVKDTWNACLLEPMRKVIKESLS